VTIDPGECYKANLSMTFDGTIGYVNGSLPAGTYVLPSNPSIIPPGSNLNGNFLFANGSGSTCAFATDPTPTESSAASKISSVPLQNSYAGLCGNTQLNVGTYLTANGIVYFSNGKNVVCRVLPTSLAVFQAATPIPELPPATTIDVPCQ
jgi:hypothetical protein